MVQLRPKGWGWAAIGACNWRDVCLKLCSGWKGVSRMRVCVGWRDRMGVSRLRSQERRSTWLIWRAFCSLLSDNQTYTYMHINTGPMVDQTLPPPPPTAADQGKVSAEDGASEGQQQQQQEAEAAAEVGVPRSMCLSG